jgi:formylglycine-generating enzyme required for sulfatase activity
MKRIAILFACTAIFALTTCENEQLITLLCAPSELVSLEIVAYAGDAQLEGGAAMEPGFTTSVFNYTVYVSKDTDRFLVSASIDGNGTIEIMCEENQETGTEHDFLDEESKVMILTVEREYMDVAEYRVTVIREETVPTARGVEISVTPGIGAFFLGRGVLPEFRVTAKPPSVGGVLSYQWYVNTENSNRGGTRINGATGTTYKMKSYETVITGTAYYYAEVINTIDGKTGITESNPCRVTFLNINDLTEKSLAMVNIPAGTVSNSNSGWDYGTWSTPGFSMGQNLVTWELWKYVFDHAEAGNYSFSNIGSHGAETYTNGWRPMFYPLSGGNKMHPVAYISWRDAAVWCNAYSEMDGLEPVYKDSDGNVFRDSRLEIESLVDTTKMTGNGYRLPTVEEWVYAMCGANPASDEWEQWNPDSYLPDPELYCWHSSGRGVINDDKTNHSITGEVGQLLPNSIGLYDIRQMMYQWVWMLPSHSKNENGTSYAYGGSFERSDINGYSSSYGDNVIILGFSNIPGGFRFARNKE